MALCIWKAALPAVRSCQPHPGFAKEATPRQAGDTHEHGFHHFPGDFTAIVDALYRFGAGQDLRDRPLFESAFSVDATLDFTGPAKRLGASIPVFEGRQPIADTILSTTGKLDTTHTITNPRLTAYDGEHARLFALIEAQHLPSDDHSRHLLLKNILTVELSRHERQWAIDHMKFENVWLDGDPSVLFPR